MFVICKNFCENDFTKKKFFLGEQETLREYKYLSEMKHPNVISALGVFLTSDNSYAIVMTL